jgi:nitrate reductase gamma subunit
MSSNASPTTEKGPKRLRPYQLSIAIGIGMGSFTLLSGIVPQFTKWHATSEVTREVFEGIPGPLQAAFYTILPAMLVWGSFQFANRIRNWERGAPDRRRTTPKNAKRRLADYRAGVYMRTLLRDSAAGLMHSMMYFGFLVLLGVTTVLELDHQLPESLKFLHGGVYQGYVFVGDFAGLVFTIGVVWAIIRRYVQQPYRIRIKTKKEHGIILGVMLAIGLTGFGAEMFRIAVSTVGGKDMSFESWSFIGYPLSQLVDGSSLNALENWHQAMWVAHVVSFIAFLALLPITMLRHIFTSPLNMYLKDRDLSLIHI